MATKKETRIFYSVLFLCYLEVLLWTACIFTGTCSSLVKDQDSTAAYFVRETNNLKELHGFERQAKDLFTKEISVQHVDIRLAAESVKAEVRFRQILEQLSVGLILGQQFFDPVSFTEQRSTQTTIHLGIPSPPQAKKRSQQYSY